MAQRGANGITAHWQLGESSPFYLKPSDYKNAAKEAEREKQEPCRISIQYSPIQSHRNKLRGLMLIWML